MAENSKKVAVLNVLIEQAGFMDLHEILANLPDSFADRSVRRWLAELTEEGRVIRVGRKRGTRYRVSETLLTEGPFGEASLAVVNQVRQPLFRRQPTSYDHEWFDSYEANRSSYFNQTEIATLEKQGQRSGDQEPAGTYARRIYNRLLLDLSYNSSRLEGNTYSLIDTERLLFEGTRAAGKLDEEMIMILNHKEAIRHLVDRAPRLEVSYDEIRTLHFLLSDGLVPARYAGKIRDQGVRVGASTYIPIESQEILDRQLFAVARKGAAIVNPYEQSLFLLVHIAYLQAFIDVNKRPARLSANIPLVKHNRVPLSFRSVEKDDYASAVIAIYEKRDVRPMADLYIASYARTCREYDATVEALGFDEIRVRYRRHRREILGTIVGDELTGDALARYLATHAALGVPQEHRDSFLEDLKEDLDELSPHRIAGLGITQRQLQRWLTLAGR